MSQVTVLYIKRQITVKLDFGYLLHCRRLVTRPPASADAAAAASPLLTCRRIRFDLRTAMLTSRC